ncbi:hypothetical protein WG66_013854 [Moniliophthora roreri]|nr:hypothetical protein WG66_013854 [Moniliophthora roreri]
MVMQASNNDSLQVCVRLEGLTAQAHKDKALRLSVMQRLFKSSSGAKNQSSEAFAEIEKDIQLLQSVLDDIRSALKQLQELTCNHVKAFLFAKGCKNELGPASKEVGRCLACILVREYRLPRASAVFTTSTIVCEAVSGMTLLEALSISSVGITELVSVPEPFLDSTFGRLPNSISTRRKHAQNMVKQLPENLDGARNLSVEVSAGIRKDIQLLQLALNNALFALQKRQKLIGSSVKAFFLDELSQIQKSSNAPQSKHLSSIAASFTRPSV